MSICCLNLLEIVILISYHSSLIKTIFIVPPFFRQAPISATSNK